MARLPDSELRAVSAYYRSAALTLEGDDSAQPDYCNAVAGLHTRLEPAALLQALLRIETEHGRERSLDQRWQARSLDLDLLAMGDLHLCRPGLQLPHPELSRRDFVLQPWADLAPQTPLPGGRNVGDSWAALARPRLQSWAQSIPLS